MHMTENKMSSIEETEKKRKEHLGIKKKQESWRDVFPPPPEDTIVLTGDVFSLMIYCFMESATTSFLSEDNILHTLVTSSSTSIQLPVWSDVLKNNFGSSLLREIMNTQQIANIGTFANAEQTVPHFAPCFQSAGISFILLTSCWLLSGYFNKSFSYNNTIGCNPNEAVKVTFKTWIFSAMLVFGASLMSGKICGCEFFPGLSKSDVEFILDSASVLVVWRFMVASMLNSF